MRKNFSGSCLDLHALDSPPARLRTIRAWSAIADNVRRLEHDWGAHRRARDGVVVVTGAGGFAASHCVVQLLQQGYTVRAVLTAKAP
eukprot:gene2927-17090_t